MVWTLWCGRRPASPSLLCAHTQLCQEVQGSHPVPTLQVTPLSGQSHPFSGWTVMARGLSSPCEMTT